MIISKLTLAEQLGHSLQLDISGRKAVLVWEVPNHMLMPPPEGSRCVHRPLTAQEAKLTRQNKKLEDQDL